VGDIQVDFRRFARELLDCSSVHDVLETLFRHIRGTPIERIRYYHYDKSLERMVSSDSINMPVDVARRFRSGFIIKSA